jgi:phosphoenolpyruvate carboxylase
MYRQNIQFPAKDAPLREDVHSLGGLIGEILLEQCGEERFDLVEGDRVASIARREEEVGAEDALLQRAAGRDPDVARDLIRAFSTWFQVVNLAEKVHRIRRRREYLNDAKSAQPGGLDDAFARLVQDGWTLSAVMELLSRLSVYPVFTSHPTESTRRTLLRKQARVAGLLLERIDPTLVPVERKANWEQIRTELTSLWQTEDHPRERLTVADEREHVLYFLSEVLYPIVPAFYEELAASLSRAFGEIVSPEILPRIIRFGSWVGGDMDGAPDINAKTIRDTLQRQHLVIVNAYYLEVQRLGERLSQSASRVRISGPLQQRLEEYARIRLASADSAPARHDQMPYREFCAQIAARLKNTYDGLPHHYESAAQLAADVRLMATSLANHQGGRAGLFHVHRLLRRIDTFGFHLATLDVRQHADVHRSVVGRGLGDDMFAERAPEERLERIRRALERDEGPSYVLDALGRRTLSVFEQLYHARHRYGREATGDYVVSGVQGVEDILSVLLLARWAEMTDKKTGAVLLDVAPLFDTVGVLTDSETVMRNLLAEPFYREHIRHRGERQVAMFGYGESNRESGVITSRWLLNRAQKSIADLCREEGVTFTSFHGRGGATSRGGSRVATLLRGAAPGSFHGVLRVTEQGSGINQGYSLRSLAMRTLEQAFGAASLALSQESVVKDVEPKHAEILESLSEASQVAYRRLVFGTKGFWDYFQEVSPIDVIERMQIGSRPISRPGASGLEGIRTVPWSFAWSQCRHLLPSWYGVGSGLDLIEALGGAGNLDEMMARMPFFGMLMDEVEFALAVADMNIARWYSGLVAPERLGIFEMVLAEHERTERWILKLRGQRRLLDGEPSQQRGMKLRNPYVDPMHLMQVDLLRRWRESGREDPILLGALVASTSGIAQGLQATG